MVKPIIFRQGRDRSDRSRGGSEQLAIFGDRRARRGAELKVPRIREETMNGRSGFLYMLNIVNAVNEYC